MKKAFLLVVACAFTFVSAQAQSSEVEAVSQTTKTEQFKTNCSFLKETLIGEFREGGVQILTILYTDLKTGNELVGLEFRSYATLLNGVGIPESLGYLDADQVNDFLLALETMLDETKNTGKKEQCTISYTAPGGIDAHSYSLNGAQYVGFRKKWITTNEFGVRQYTYTQNPPFMTINKLAKLISSIKEAQTITEQYLNK